MKEVRVSPATVTLLTVNTLQDLETLHQHTMSSRKLQQEFDKLQKKVTEGLQQFDDIYSKIATTENNSLKEKLEGELRKEIKKLQRSRDQVKQWLGDSSNKLDKNLLQENRSRIENAMERFKEVEKVLKMKQFSNEGLELQTKLGARGLDEAKKIEASRYVVDVMDELNRQNELLSAEMDQYLHKKKLAAIQASLDDLTEKVERNNSHIAKLEHVLRSLENDRLEPSRIDDIRDDLDYYVENNQSADFIEYDDFYDSLELDDSLEVPVVFPAQSVQASHSAPSQSAATSQSAPTTASSNPTTATIVAPRTAPLLEGASSSPKTSQTSQLAGQSPARPVRASTPATSKAPPPGLNTSSGLNSNGLNPNGLNSNGLNSNGLNSSNGPNSSTIGTPVVPKLTVAEELKKKALTHAAAAAAAIPVSSSNGKPLSLLTPLTLSLLTPLALTPLALILTLAPLASVLASATTHSSAISSPATVEHASLQSPLPSLSMDRSPWETTSKVGTISQSRLTEPLPFQTIAHQLEASLLNCPDSFDLEVPRQYNPTNVHPSSVDYPQEPMFELNSAAIMKKFDTDTLFFCFYYNENHDPLSKWNAARELSARGWIFNLESKQWFSKDDKPKTRLSMVAHSADPLGSFKYFDYESSWLVRRKENFTFLPELQQTF